jgi:hypothetical protein
MTIASGRQYSEQAEVALTTKGRIIGTSGGRTYGQWMLGASPRQGDIELGQHNSQARPLVE